MNRIVDFFSNCWWTIKKIIPKYKNVPIYRPFFWKLIFQRITKGYDESVTWDLYYEIARWIYPRLILFYDKVNESGAVPYEYERKMIDIYQRKGFEYNKKFCRFEDLSVEKEMHKDALEMWKEDVWKICECFRDILAEEEDFDEWRKGWLYYSEAAQNKYTLMKTDKDRKKYWDMFGFDRKWYPGIIFTPYDFSEKYRKERLKLFSEHFQELWW